MTRLGGRWVGGWVGRYLLADVGLGVLLAFFVVGVAVDVQVAVQVEGRGGGDLA